MQNLNATRTFRVSANASGPTGPLSYSLQQQVSHRGMSQAEPGHSTDDVSGEVIRSQRCYSASYAMLCHLPDHQSQPQACARPLHRPAHRARHHIDTLRSTPSATRATAPRTRRRGTSRR